MSQLQFGRIHLYWLGSGHMVDYLIHQIDECCWIKDAWPVAAHGFGGRAPGSTDAGQNLDVYSMEYTFADGTKAFCGFRRINRGESDFATYLHGTKSAAQFSGKVHAATVHMFKDQRIAEDNIAWTPTPDAFSPWQYEWNDFIASIRNDRPHNEAQRAVYSDLTTLMGRAACHLNRTVTWDEMMKSDFKFCPDVDNLDMNSPLPSRRTKTACSPCRSPVPGRKSDRTPTPSKRAARHPRPPAKTGRATSPRRSVAGRLRWWPRSSERTGRPELPIAADGEAAVNSCTIRRSR
jgi:hypothetical protein